MRYDLRLPLDPEAVKELRVGDEVSLTGDMLVGRDQVHLRLTTLMKEGKDLPVDLAGETIFYMGPAPAPEGFVIGSCGPTTSARMDPFAPMLLEGGLLAMIGKGPRSAEVLKAVERNQAVYFTAFGGCGALYADCVEAVELIAFEDLGPEALYRLTVKDFPVIVAMDAAGGSVYRDYT